MISKQLQIILSLYLIFTLYLYINYKENLYEESYLLPIGAVTISIIYLNIIKL